MTQSENTGIKLEYSLASCMTCRPHDVASPMYSYIYKFKL